MLVLIEGLSDTCDTWVALGADPWTPEQHLLRHMANFAGSTDAILFNVHRDRDVTEPRMFTPLRAPERKRTPEQQAAEEARQLEERQRQEIEEKSAMVTHDIGSALFSGKTTMLELSRRIKEAGGLN